MRFISVLMILVLGPFGIAHAGVITLDFDSVALAAGTCTDASPYLNGFGITFSPVTSGASSIICNVTGSAITPSSPPNIFGINPPVTNTNVSGELIFSTPLTALSFTRTTVNPATAIPAWDAKAYDASNTLLSSVGEALTFPGPTAQTFTLNGPGITHVLFDAFNSAHVTYNFPPLDDMVLTLAPVSVPEPGTIALLGVGIAVCALARCRGRRSPPASCRHVPA